MGNNNDMILSHRDIVQVSQQQNDKTAGQTLEAAHEGVYLRSQCGQDLNAGFRS